jgi:hypothetical protein
LPPLLGEKFSVAVTLCVDWYLGSENMELMTRECVGQVCSKTVYEVEVVYHDSTEVRTHMAFHRQMRWPLLERPMLIVGDPSSFLVHNSIASCYSVKFVTFCT